MKLTRKKQIFISYAREDMEHALRVKDFFEQHGVGTWFDQLDSVPGARWRKHTLDGIRESDYFLALLSKISIEKKDGFVWKEFNLALKKQRSFKDDRKFIFPAQIDRVEIPKEFELFHSEPLCEESLIKILEVIETQELPEPPAPTAPGSRGLFWKRLLTLILLVSFVVVLIMAALNNLNAAPLIFKATIRDTAQNPIQDAYAYILGPNSDTIIKSPPSGTNGQVYFELDTHEIRAIVWYYHPLYVKVSKSYTLMSHETPRYVELVPRESERVSSQPTPLSSKEKLFLLSGLDLTAAEKQQIKKRTGYSFSYANAAERISVDYDHTYHESAVPGKYVFLGSQVFLICNSAKIDTRIYFPPDGGLARTKEDIDRDNEAAFAQVLDANRTEIVNTVITCLNDF